MAGLGSHCHGDELQGPAQWSSARGTSQTAVEATAQIRSLESMLLEHAEGHEKPRQREPRSTYVSMCRDTLLAPCSSAACIQSVIKL